MNPKGDCQGSRCKSMWRTARYAPAEVSHATYVAYSGTSAVLAYDATPSPFGDPSSP